MIRARAEVDWGMLRVVERGARLRQDPRVSTHDYTTANARRLARPSDR